MTTTTSTQTDKIQHYAGKLGAVVRNIKDAGKLAGILLPYARRDPSSEVEKKGFQMLFGSTRINAELRESIWLVMVFAIEDRNELPAIHARLTAYGWKVSTLSVADPEEYIPPEVMKIAEGMLPVLEGKFRGSARRGLVRRLHEKNVRGYIPEIHRAIRALSVSTVLADRFQRIAGKWMTQDSSLN